MKDVCIHLIPLHLVCTQCGAGEARKVEAKKPAPGKVPSDEFLRVARELAVELCNKNGTVTSDDVRLELEGRGIVPPDPNTWGRLFLDWRFKRTGESTRSIIPSRKRARIEVWRTTF